MLSPVVDTIDQVRTLLDEYEQFLSGKAEDTMDAYLQATRETARTYVFTSQRSERLTEEGISYWFRTLKMQSTENQRDVIQDLTFHDLRYDFAHRAREAGWAPEKVAYYLGQVSTQGVPTLQTTIGAPQVSREHVRQKLNNIKGLHTDEGTRK